MTMCYLSHTIFAYSVAITFYFTSTGTQTGSNLLSNESQSSAHRDVIVSTIVSIHLLISSLKRAVFPHHPH